MAIQRYPEPVEGKPSFYTAPGGRVYVEVSDLALLIGVTRSDLDFKFRPHAFAVPRDFIWAHGRLWFAVLSLPQVVDALFDAGRADAAKLLRDLVEKWVPAAAAAGTLNAERLTFNAQVGGTTPNAERRTPNAERNLGGKAAPASDSWLRRWEAERE